MTAVTPITIGIPYRDEGQDFALLAGGLVAALQEMPPDVQCEVIICVNGSAPGFSEQLAGLLGSTGLGQYQSRVITSPEGKLSAECAIGQARQLHGYLAFVDSDVVLEKRVLRLLWTTLETDQQCMIAYGQPVPVFPRELSLLHRLLRVHYSLRERGYHRPYFHGRAFILREWFFDPPSEPRVHPRVSDRLRLSVGPIVDDIAMSRMALSRWGLGAIREVQEANVYFDPPDTVRGIYAAALRVALEVQRLDLLYPDHVRVLPKTSCTSSWRFGGLRGFSLRLKMAHLSYRILDDCIKSTARVHVALVKAGVLQVKTLWVRVPGTKHFARNRREWEEFRAFSPEKEKTV
jgi:hypothetical protein